MDSKKKRNLLEHKSYFYNPKIRFWENDDIGIRLAVSVPIEISLIELFELLEFLGEKKKIYNKEKDVFYDSM